jgi:hypothetical protein
MKDNIDRIPAIEWLFSRWAERLPAASRSDFLGSGKSKSMEADFIRTTGASSLHSGDDGSALGGTMQAPCSFVYRSSLHFSYRNFPPSFHEGYVARPFDRSKWTLSGIASRIVYMLPLSRPIDSGLSQVPQTPLIKLSLTRKPLP